MEHLLLCTQMAIGASKHKQGKVLLQVPRCINRCLWIMLFLFIQELTHSLQDQTKNTFCNKDPYNMVILSGDFDELDKISCSQMWVFFCSLVHCYSCSLCFAQVQLLVDHIFDNVSLRNRNPIRASALVPFIVHSAHAFGPHMEHFPGRESNILLHL